MKCPFLDYQCTLALVSVINLFHIRNVIKVADHVSRAELFAGLDMGAINFLDEADQTPSETPAGTEQSLALWQQARAALAQAEATLAAGEADATTREQVAALRAAVETGSGRAAMALAQARREVRLVADLDEARLARGQATSGGLRMDSAASAAAYARACTAFGLEVLRLPEAEAVKRVRGLRPELRTAVVLALDDWAFCVGDRKVGERLRQVASGADDDAWRREFRKAKDRPQLEALTAGALSGELPVSSLTWLAVALRKQGAAERAEVVLRRAVQLHPADFWVHYELGVLLAEKGRQIPAVVLEERLGHFRAAVAVRPQAAPAHHNLGLALYDKGDLEGAIAAYRQALTLDPKLALAHNNLGLTLYDKGDLEGAIAAYRQALTLDPKLALAHNNLANTLYAKKDLEGAIAAYRQALTLDPKLALAHNNLGLALYAKKDLARAIACYHKALALDPNCAPVHNNLGNVLRDQKDLSGAIACYHKALELDPKHAPTHCNLGQALQMQGDVKGAIASYHKALDLDPKLVQAHTNLGGALYVQGDLKGAIASCTKALQLDPKDAKAHLNLGNALADQGDVKRAIACYKKALEFDSKDAQAHNNLGTALADQGDMKGAIACYTKALDLDPKLVQAHTNLGQALQAQGDVKGAIACFTKALTLDPKNAHAHGVLGRALVAQGAFPEARDATQQALQLLPAGHSLRPLVTRQLHQCQRLLNLDARLTAILAGDDQPKDTADRLDLAYVCLLKKLNVSAARLYADAFAADAQVADDLQAAHRYYAALCAALAGCRQGKDADKLGDKERAHLRQQAQAWSRADLKLWTKLVDKGQPQGLAVTSKVLQHWQYNLQLAGLREEKALAQLPEAEQEACRQLWAEVAALLKRATAQK
jgi:superkiller protein 3